MIYPNPWPLNVIIMAGGKGSRLKSLTTHTHKSLIEIAEKPIILHLVEHLISAGFSTIHVSVGHLSHQITNYLEDGSKLGISIKYIHEITPMGSIGSLTLKKDWQYDHFLVLNGDIFTNFNTVEFISAFFKEKIDMAILTLMNNLEIPWGVLNVSPNGNIISLTEKPKYPIQINTGVYLFNRHILNLLSISQPTEGWELIQSALNSVYKVISIPLNDGYWIDIGTTETLLKAQEMTRIDYIN